MQNSSKRISLAISMALFGIMSNPAAATPITITNPFNFLDNVADNSIGLKTGIREQFGAHDVTPNGEQGTTGTATRGSNTRDLNFVPFTTAPDYFVRSIDFNPGTTGTGAWSLNFQNGTDTAQRSTLSIAGASVVPFVTSVSISGNGAAPSFNWKTPSTFAPDGVQIRIRDTEHFVGSGGVGENGIGNIIYTKTFAGNTTSFTVNPNDPNLKEQLLKGHTYSIEIDLLDTRNNLPQSIGLSNILSQSRAFFDFSLLPENSPPNVFLPALVPDAAPYYKFNVTDIVAGQTIFIDPLVAIGYDFAIGAGDPNFASVTLPEVGDDLFDLFACDGSSLGTAHSGIAFGFSAGGLSCFQVRGIEVSAGLDPNDGTAFVAGLTFTGPGNFTGTMTPVSVNVPEPASLALLVLGLTGLGFARRKQT